MHPSHNMETKSQAPLTIQRNVVINSADPDAHNFKASETRSECGDRHLKLKFIPSRRYWGRKDDELDVLPTDLLPALVTKAISIFKKRVDFDDQVCFDRLEAIQNKVDRFSSET